ncbi:10349_t:CDS:2 [Funneliformis geosporum]|nr:10349_t:CDS:2 [Funneliformis geosporum]
MVDENNNSNRESELIKLTRETQQSGRINTIIGAVTGLVTTVSSALQIRQVEMDSENKIRKLKLELSSIQQEAEYQERLNKWKSGKVEEEIINEKKELNIPSSSAEELTSENLDLSAQKDKVVEKGNEILKDLQSKGEDLKTKAGEIKDKARSKGNGVMYKKPILEPRVVKCDHLFFRLNSNTLFDNGCAKKFEIKYNRCSGDYVKKNDCSY